MRHIVLRADLDSACTVARALANGDIRILLIHEPRREVAGPALEPRRRGTARALVPDGVGLACARAPDRFEAIFEAAGG
jgi:hypothetical protein